MGLLSQLKRDLPATSTDYVKEGKRVSTEDEPDQRTSFGVELESGRVPHHHDPVLEARVVRKLDCRVVGSFFRRILFLEVVICCWKNLDMDLIRQTTPKLI